MSRLKNGCVWLAFAIVLGSCRSPSQRDDGPGALASAETPAGFRRVVEDGWSLAVPSTFAQRPPPDDEEGSPMIWLLNQGDRDAKGAPYVFFAYHRKPADFSSRVFGLAALDGLKRQAPRKTVLMERQHALGELIVTDIEVLTNGPSRRTHEWRRLFVIEGRAYILTFAAQEESAAELARTAHEVIDSLARHPG